MDTLAQNLSEKLPVQPIPQPRPAGDDAADAGLSQRLEYLDRGTGLLTVSGVVDTVTAPRLAEMLASRLCSTLNRLVVDLSGLGSLGVIGISVLIEADLRARSTGTELVIVHGNNQEVTGALTVIAKRRLLRIHPGTAATAVSPSEA